MAPDWGYNGEETAVLIEGDGFYPHVTATGANDFTWDRQYRAWLEGQASLELDGVSIASYSELEGRVPAGLAPGLYDLRLRSPSGEEVVLADAFTATDTRADHFETEDVDLSHAVNERVIVEVFVVDPEGDPVASAEEITVLVEADDPSGVSFPTDLTLDQQESLGDDEVGVTGSLGEDGRGLFTITSSVPDLLTLWITSADAGSPLTGTAILLDFSAGNVANVEIELPNTDGLTAGDTFDVSIRLTDIDGNATRGVAASLLLYEACPRGSWQQAVQIIDRELAVPVMVTAATTTDCPANAIQAIGVSAGTEISGSSETFDVAPGDAESLAVIASPSEITAGIDPLDVWVWAVDAWGNELSAYDADLTLYDSLGGLDPDATIGFQSCTAFSTGLSVAVCEASLWKAGEGVTLRAVASDGVEGESNPFDVLAGDVSSLEVEVSDDEVVAGVSFTAALHVEDSFGNLVEADLSTTDPVWLDVDATGVDRGVTCTIDDDASGGGTSLFDCVAETAGTGHSLRVSLSLGGETLYANSTLYDVINGELDQVEVSLPYDSLRAGNAITVALTGTDAYGNPYVTGSDMDVKLDDETGTLALETGGAATVTLSGGEGSAAVVITAAIADDRITASQSGADLGTSEAFDVLPAEVQHLQVSPAATWAWLDTGVAVALEAHDIYENIVTTYDETVTLSSSEGLGSDHEVTSWVDGAAEIVYAFDSTGFGDLLVAIGEDGTSGDADVEVDVLDGDCSAGPTARLRVAGSSPATLCLSSGSTPASWISASRSTAGAATIRVFHFDDGSGEWARSTTSDLLRSWTEEGGWPIRVVVADEAGCADETSTAVYVAESDGRPAGPMLVSLADSTLNTGTDSTLVEVQASDCSGDPADGTLYVRADLGAIEATASGDVEETDEGLAFEVSGGTGELSWSVVDERFDGTATLHVGAADAPRKWSRGADGGGLWVGDGDGQRGLGPPNRARRLARRRLDGRPELRRRVVLRADEPELARGLGGQRRAPGRGRGRAVHRRDHPGRRGRRGRGLLVGDRPRGHLEADGGDRCPRPVGEPPGRAIRGQRQHLHAELRRCQRRGDRRVGLRTRHDGHPARRRGRERRRSRRAHAEPDGRERARVVAAGRDRRRRRHRPRAAAGGRDRAGRGELGRPGPGWAGGGERGVQRLGAR